MAKPKTTTTTVVLKGDGNLDGIPDTVYQTATTYDKNGNELLIVENGDYFYDGVWDYQNVTERTFDKKGNVLSIKYSVDGEGDGTTDYLTTTVYTYDKRSNLLSEVNTSDFDPATPETFNVNTRTNKYDRHGNLIESRLEVDSQGEEPGNFLYTTNYTYEKGRLVKEEGDTNSDGVNDYSIEYSYSTKGRNTTSKVAVTNYVQEDEADSILETVTTTDKQGRPLLIVETQDWWADGVKDYVYETSYSYDKKGRVLSFDTRADWGADGVFDQTGSTVTQYNKAGQILSEVVTRDDNLTTPDPSYVYTTLNTYDRRGNITEKLMQYDWEGPDYSQDRYVYSYDHGRLVQNTTDYNDNGIIDYTTEYYYS